MFKSKDILIFVLICFLLGILFVWQFFASKQFERLKTGEENQLLALEIASLTKANTDLRLEIQNLSMTAEKYKKVLEDRQSALVELEKNLQKYKILAGVTRIEGPGVEIKIEGDLEQTQMIDLINALRNIGVEGISINKKRFVISSYFSTRSDGLYLNGVKLEKPLIIDVIGNAPLIEEALKRRGGIIEQIQASSANVKISVTKKDNLILEPVKSEIH